ncbi:MAG: hypothetical protein AAF533_27035 [Acidobacteriota bacterium]
MFKSISRRLSAAVVSLAVLALMPNPATARTEVVYSACPQKPIVIRDELVEETIVWEHRFENCSPGEITRKRTETVTIGASITTTSNADTSIDVSIPIGEGSVSIGAGLEAGVERTQSTVKQSDEEFDIVVPECSAQTVRIKQQVYEFDYRIPVWIKKKVIEWGPNPRCPHHGTLHHCAFPEVIVAQASGIHGSFTLRVQGRRYKGVTESEDHGRCGCEEQQEEENQDNTGSDETNPPNEDENGGGGSDESDTQPPDESDNGEGGESEEGTDPSDLEIEPSDILKEQLDFGFCNSCGGIEIADATALVEFGMSIEPVIPLLRVEGQTEPGAQLVVVFTGTKSGPQEVELQADDSGAFSVSGVVVTSGDYGAAVYSEAEMSASLDMTELQPADADLDQALESAVASLNGGTADPALVMDALAATAERAALDGLQSALRVSWPRSPELGRAGEAVLAGQAAREAGQLEEALMAFQSALSLLDPED